MLLRLIKMQPTAANVAVNLLKKVKKNVEKLLKILQKLFIIEEIVRFFASNEYFLHIIKEKGYGF